jgi:hypothetical protein
MSGAHASLVVLSDEKARRGRILGAGQGRHRRTPEAWAQSELERTQLKSDKIALTDEVTGLKGEVARLKDQVRKFVNGGLALQKERDKLAEEVRLLRTLTGRDANNPVNQQTHSFKMVERPAEPLEAVTHPISVGDLFQDPPPRDIRSAPSVKPPIPNQTVYPDPKDIPPMPSVPPFQPSVRALPSTPAPVPDAATRLVARVNPEMVQTTTEHRLMALWDSPQVQVPDARRTA